MNRNTSGSCRVLLTVNQAGWLYLPKLSVRCVRYTCRTLSIRTITREPRGDSRLLMAESSCRDMSNRKTKTFESIIKIKLQVTPSFADSSGLTQPCYKSISSREGDTTIGHQDWANSLMKVALNTCISLFSVVLRRKFQNNKQLTLTNCVRLTILNYQQVLCQVCAWFELGLSTAFSFSKRLESALCDFVYKAICILCISVLLTIFQFLCYRHSTCSY